MKAREALEIGLLNHLVAPDLLMPKAMEIARAIAANDTRIVKGIKELMIRDVGASWREMQANELGGAGGRAEAAAGARGVR